MNVQVILFGAINLKKEEVQDKRVIEIGSYDVNGSLRPLLESYNPQEYIGVDLSSGKGVDVVCDVADLAERFGEQSFDVVLSTELLEHVKDWKRAIHNIKAVCKKGGSILITCRSLGFVYHGHPHDFWRYEISDMEYIFADCAITALKQDPAKGVLLKAVKPQDFSERDLSDYALYSIVTNTRVRDIQENYFKSLYFRGMIFRKKIGDLLRKSVDIIVSFIR
jgi:SAM-dependent methyltransferase